ncbi:MAG TPA: response regulator transcription factor [Aggregatilineales bacterium]|nr:response regulator transcription factor [Aggregatilineales bacterium]
MNRNQQTILIIDDDPVLLELVSDHLGKAGYRPLTCSDASASLHLATEAHPDLIVLDLMMPGMDGWEVCSRIRASTTIPIILLSAKSEELDKLRGFRIGVDDYVTKPFSLAELTARIGAVLARTARGPTPSRTLASGDLTIDFEQRRVTVNGQPVELTPTEYRLLDALARQAHRTVATDKLIELVWGPGYLGEVEQVKHFVWTLRKKIEADPGNPAHLITVRGFGYRFE